MSFPPPSAKQARLIWLAVSALAIAVLVVLIVALIWGLGQVLQLLAPVLWPLAVAGVIAYLLDPLVDFIESRGAPRTRAIIFVFALAAMIVIALFGSVVPQVVRETGQLVEKIPTYSTNAQARIQVWIDHPPAFLVKLLNLTSASRSGTNTVAATNTLTAPAGTNTVAATNEFTAPTGTNTPPATGTTNQTSTLLTKALNPETLQSATEWLAKAVPKAGSWIFGQASRVASWFGVLAGLALVPVYAFYFLLEKEGIEQKWTNYLPVAKSEFKDELVFVLKSINGYLIVFFRSQVMVALCDGVLYTIGFYLIGLPYAFLVGVMATVLTMIPFLGAIVTCVAALIIAFVQYGDWLHPLLVVAVFAVVQTLEGLVISPKIMGDRVGLHPLTIIIAVMVGTTVLGGLLGGILAIPLTAALRVLMFRYVWKKRPT
ncbi:MAG TPA: AI-2E family transporter [Verrucomicrobiae bacterium]|nr:AI-2E family transporter [Verrucomicrobiae bacterium]